MASSLAERWRQQVDTLMRREYLIGLEDAGASDEEVARHFASGQSPEAFVAWFGEKYDLQRLGDFWPTTPAAPRWPRGRSD